MIQENALRSWLALRDDIEIILLGSDPGVGEMASHYKVRHIPELTRNDKGTPLISSIFNIGIQEASHDLRMFINSDIILHQSFVDAATICRKQFQRFLMIGECHNLDIKLPMTFNTDLDQKDLLLKATTEGELRGKEAIDFFLFTGNPWPSIPDFAIGRPGYDNWLVAQVWKSGLPVIDATYQALCVHQNHDYSHAGSGKKDDVFKGVEAKDNYGWMAPGESDFGMHDAPYCFSEQALVPARLPHYVNRRIERFWQHHKLLSRLMIFRQLKYLYAWINYR